MLLSTLQHREALQSSGDYTGYRRYATRRLKKLRKREGLTVRSSKTYKPKESAAGQWQFSLLLSERSWAAAMAAKAALDADAASSTTLKSQISSKLAKASKYASAAISEQGADATPVEKLELAVYKSLVAGESALDKQQWSNVIAEYSKARVGLVSLMKSTPEGDASTSAYSETLATSVDINLHFAFSQQGNHAAVDVAEAAREYVVEHESSFVELVNSVNPKPLSKEAPKNLLNEIHFRQHTAKVRYNNLAEALIRAQKKDEALNAATKSEDMSAFDTVLSLWDQVEFVTSNLINEIVSAGQDREQDLDIISTYAKFNLLYRRIQRDSLVAAQEKGRTNAVRLYDVVLQSCASMAELPGVFSDSELSFAIERMQNYFSIKRTLSVAALHPVGFVEELALVKLAYDQLQKLDSDQEGDSVMELSAESAYLIPVSEGDMKKLRGEVENQLRISYSATVLYQEVKNMSKVKGSTASDNQFIQIADKESPVVPVDVEAKHLEPVPVKPVFYDIAYNYLPDSVHDAGSTHTEATKSSSSSTTETTGESTKESNKKKGLFGLF